jgi:hypothetical protein
MRFSACRMRALRNPNLNMSTTRKTALLFLLGAAASSAAAQSLMSTNAEVVQAVGDAVPGLPGVTIGGTSPFGTPVIDLNGNMLWRAKLTGGSIVTGTDDQALFYGRTANDLVMLLQRGSPEPSGTLPGVTVNYSATGWDVARISPASNMLLFGSTLAGTGVTTTNDTCIFWGPIGGLQILAREGDLAPSGGATFTGNISGANNATAINNTGMAVIKTKLVGGDVNTAIQNDDAWLTGTPGGLMFMCREADTLLGGTVAVGTLDGFKPEIDDAGRVLFPQSLSQTLGSTPANSTNDSTLMLYTPGLGLSIVVREGDPAPGPGGCLFGSISSSSGPSNHGFSRTNGHFVLTNSMTGGDVAGNTTDTSVFAGTIGGTIARVARESEAAPTGVPGEIYQTLFPNGIAQINDNGTVVFVAQLGPVGNPGLSTFNDVAVFLAKAPYGPGDVQMILREGDAVAGLPVGWVIGNTNGGGMSSSGTSLLLNEQDVVLINVAGVGDPTAANWGVPAQVAWDATHLARLSNMQDETYMIQGSAHVQSSAMSVNATGSGDGGNQSFNNNGDQCSRVFFIGAAPTAILRSRVGSLEASPSSLPATGGTQAWQLDAGVANAGGLYVLAGTLNGSRPGFSLGGLTVPLTQDFWFSISLLAANGPVYSGSWGLLDANGRGSASFNFPAGFTWMQGALFHHAFVVLNPSTAAPQFVSEAAALRIY